MLKSMLLAAAASVVPVGQVGAAVLYNTGFESPAYTAGIANGQDSWTDNSSPANNFYQIVSGGLGANGGSQRLQVAGNSANARYSHSFAPQTGTVYFSFTYSPSDITSSANFFWVTLNANAGSDNSSLGVVHRDFTQMQARARTSGGANTNSTGSTMVANGIYTVVVKVSKSSGGNYNTVNAWLDPVGNIEPAPIASMTAVADSGISTVNTVWTRTGGVGAPNPVYRVDNLVVGTTYADVIPEPAFISLLGVAGLALIRCRRA